MILKVKKQCFFIDGWCFPFFIFSSSLRYFHDTSDFCTADDFREKKKRLFKKKIVRIFCSESHFFFHPVFFGKKLTTALLNMAVIKMDVFFSHR